MQAASRESAQRLLDERKRVLSKDDPPQRAQIQDFTFRGYVFYESSQAALERLGFMMLGDFALGQPEWTGQGFRSFVRVMRSGDRQAVCSIIDATPHPIGMSRWVKVRFYLAGRHKQHLKGVSLRTELSDGRFIITATAADFMPEELPPAILRETVTRETPVSELLKRHRDRVSKAITQTKATVVTIGTAEEFGQSFVRHKKTTRAFREQVGYAFTDKEQRDFIETESPSLKSTAQGVLEAMRTLEDDRKKQAS